MFENSMAEFAETAKKSTYARENFRARRRDFSTRFAFERMRKSVAVVFARARFETREIFFDEQAQSFSAADFLRGFDADLRRARPFVSPRFRYQNRDAVVFNERSRFRNFSAGGERVDEFLRRFKPEFDCFFDASGFGETRCVGLRQAQADGIVFHSQFHNV